ncbi:hypothetical protein [Cellulophaga sp. E16_2]|uniref:hypothetical protein n=1 Tax=Cellulophaga sp. E16_2 TaxID=2789297 RepID=UPI001A929A1E|nr:hypothetical protein [Cellulophaga sp. E16_2]
MKRRSFLISGGITAFFSGINFGFGAVKNVLPPNHPTGVFPPPEITDRLYQGPFINYGHAANVPGSDVVMTTTPVHGPVRNFGMGLVTYICDEVGPPKPKDGNLRNAIEKLAKWELGDVLYIRVDWRDIQKEAGKLDFPEHWNLTFEMAKKYGKRVAFRIQLMSPVIEPESIPDFLKEKVPMIKLGTTDEIGIKGKVHYVPQYDHPEFIKAFKEMDDLLAEKYNGHELLEYVDTCMYGFWGEGHTWPFEGNPLSDYYKTKNTFVEMFRYQANNWSKTPLTTNTQPDFNHVGNDEVLEETIRSYNWLRTDTIFIENSQIDILSNRPPWIGATIEQGITKGGKENLRVVDGIMRNENIISHVKDVGPTYFSLWNWHDIALENLLSYHKEHPKTLNEIAKNIGYKVRPSWIWSFEKEGYQGLVLGLVNDGIAGVPGALRIVVTDKEKTFLVSGSLDPGYPLPGKVRQAVLMLPKNINWEGLHLYAEIEIKGVKRPVKWACDQDLNEDGALVLKRNI